MSNFASAVEVYTNFITPPDSVENDNHTVVLIDATAEQLDHLAEFCSNANCSYNVYIYNNGMNNIDWLNSALAVADAFLVNTEPNDLSPVKDHIAESPKAWYYGPKHFLMNKQSINNPEKYFQDYENQIK